MLWKNQRHKRRDRKYRGVLIYAECSGKACLMRCYVSRDLKKVKDQHTLVFGGKVMGTENS